MQIRFSRHARRRAALYKIPESTIRGILKDIRLSDGKYEVVQDTEGFALPIKIAFSVENDIITVVTNYPLKKRRRK